MISATLALSYCKSSYKSNTAEFRPTQFDSVIRDIPKNKYGRPVLFYNNILKTGDKLGIGSLNNGYDSIQIRIWYNFGRTDTSQVLIIGRNATEWFEKIIKFVYINNNGEINVLSTESTNPNSGWINLLTMIDHSNIMKLPDQSKIAEYPDYTDGKGIIIETSTSRLYRIYHYQEPFLNQEHFSNAADIVKFLHYIKSEFDLKYVTEI